MRFPSAAWRRYAPRMPKRHVRDDLFSIFPDLPWRTHTASTGQSERVQRVVREAQIRVGQNIRGQREAAERVRAVIARRRLPSDASVSSSTIRRRSEGRRSPCLDGTTRLAAPTTRG